MKTEYLAILHKDEDTGFGISFPDAPGCVSAGDTPEEALKSGAEALQGHLQVSIDHGDALPEPSKVLDRDAIDMEGFVRLALVAVERPTRARRINITIDEALLARIDRAAEQRGMNRSAYLSEGGRRMMEEG